MRAGADTLGFLPVNVASSVAFAGGTSIPDFDVDGVFDGDGGFGDRLGVGLREAVAEGDFGGRYSTAVSRIASSGSAV